MTTAILAAGPSSSADSGGAAGGRGGEGGERPPFAGGINLLNAARRLSQRLSKLWGTSVSISKDYVWEAVREGRPHGTLLRGRYVAADDEEIAGLVSAPRGIWLVDPASIEPEAQRMAARPPHSRSRAGGRRGGP